jgi:hypothetical protein
MKFIDVEEFGHDVFEQWLNQIANTKNTLPLLNTLTSQQFPGKSIRYKIEKYPHALYIYIKVKSKEFCFKLFTRSILRKPCLQLGIDSREDYYLDITDMFTRKQLCKWHRKISKHPFLSKKYERQPILESLYKFHLTTEV